MKKYLMISGFGLLISSCGMQQEMAANYDSDDVYGDSSEEAKIAATTTKTDKAFSDYLENSDKLDQEKYYDPNEGPTYFDDGQRYGQNYSANDGYSGWNDPYYRYTYNNYYDPYYSPYGNTAYMNSNFAYYNSLHYRRYQSHWRFNRSYCYSPFGFTGYYNSPTYGYNMWGNPYNNWGNPYNSWGYWNNGWGSSYPWGYGNNGWNSMYGYNPYGPNYYGYGNYYGYPYYGGGFGGGGYYAGNGWYNGNNDNSGSSNNGPRGNVNSSSSNGSTYQGNTIGDYAGIASPAPKDKISNVGQSYTYSGQESGATSVLSGKGSDAYDAKEFQSGKTYSNLNKAEVSSISGSRANVPFRGSSEAYSKENLNNNYNNSSSYNNSNWNNNSSTGRENPYYGSDQYNGRNNSTHSESSTGRNNNSYSNRGRNNYNSGQSSGNTFNSGRTNTGSSSSGRSSSPARSSGSSSKSSSSSSSSKSTGSGKRR